METQPATEETVETDEAFRAAVRKGIESAELGHQVAYAEVKEWLASWGTDHELPLPRRK